MLLTHILLLEWSFLLSYIKEKCNASKNLASTCWYGQNGLQIIYDNWFSYNRFVYESRLLSRALVWRGNGWRKEQKCRRCHGTSWKFLFGLRWISLCSFMPDLWDLSSGNKSSDPVGASWVLERNKGGGDARETDCFWCQGGMMDLFTFQGKVIFIARNRAWNLFMA